MSADATAHYLAEFAAFEGAETAADGDGLRALRRDAIERFGALGFPTRKLEDWRYTNLRALEGAAPSRSAADASAKIEADTLGAMLAGAPEAARLVFVDGLFAPSLSEGEVAPGVRVTRLADVRGDDDALEAWLAAGDTDEHDDAFACLNAAFVEDGALVTIERNARPERPLHLVFVSSGARGAAYPRVEIVAESGSEAVVVQDHVSVAEAATLTDAVVRIAVEANAKLDHVVVQREAGAGFHLSNTRVVQRRDSRFFSHVLTLDGGLVRNHLEIELQEPGAEARMDGAFLGGHTQHVENQTLVVHAAPHCESHELYKGVLGGESRGVFRGRIDVRPHAQKTNATQSNPNLLITDKAEIDTKPQLEIRADDVKCSHGSTVGRLDEDALFFLRARGLFERDARALLTAGFAAEVTERLPSDALERWAGHLLAERLHAADGALAGERAGELASESVEGGAGEGRA